MKEQNKIAIEELYKEKYLDGCIKAGLIYKSDIDNETIKYKNLIIAFRYFNLSFDFYCLSEFGEIIFFDEEQLDKRLQNIYTLLSKKMLDFICFDQDSLF